MKRLLWDCETSPNICLSWRVGRKITLSPSNILKERAMISLAWKWHGERGVHALTWDKNQDDAKMLREFAKVLDEADEIVAWFGDGFDIRWFRTRCLLHKIRIRPDYKTVDPMKWARSKLLLNSCKLDYVGQFLGVGSKLKTEFDLWKRIVLDKDAPALKRMVKYNCEDVRLLERVYDRLSEIVLPPTHAGVLAGGEKWSCPRCESEKVIIQKTKFTAAGTRSTAMQCGKCHGYFTINDKVRREYQEEMNRRKK